MAEEKATTTAAKPTDTKDFTQVPLDERTTVKDVDDKTRQLVITETDGTVVDVNITVPKLREAESIDDSRSEVVATDDGKSSAIRPTSSRFHQALFTMFSAAVVDNKPAGKIDWDFFDAHEYATYSWLMNQADTFLSTKFKAA